MDDNGEVGGEEFDGDGYQDDTEELAEDEDHLVAEPALEFLEEADDDIVDDDVEQEGEEDVDGGILGAEREERGDGAGTGNEREGDGDDGGSRAHALVLDEFASHDHLEGEQEEHEGTRDGEGGDVDAEEVEEGFAGEEEEQEEAEGHAGGVEGFDVLAAVLHADEDGDGTGDVDDGEHDDEGADNFDDVDLMQYL